MKSLIICITILTFSKISLSSEIKSIGFNEALHDVTHVNDGLFSDTRLQCSENSPLEELNFSSESYNKCATDLCGPADKLDTAWLTDANFNSKVPEALLMKAQKMDLLFVKVVDTTLKQSLEQIERLKQNIKDEKYLERGLTFKDEVSKFLFEPYVKIAVDPTFIEIDKRLVVTIAPPANASKDFIFTLNDFAKKMKSDLIRNTESLLSSNIYSDKSEIEALAKLHFEKLKSEFLGNDKIPEAESAKAMIDEITGMLKKAKSRKQYEEVLVMTSELQTLLSPQVNADVPDHCTDERCLNAIRERMNAPELKSKLEEFEKYLRDPVTKVNVINRCKANLIMADLDRSNKEKANELLKAARQDMINNVLPLFSKHSREIAKRYLMEKVQVNNNKIKDFEGSLLDNFPQKVKSKGKNPWYAVSFSYDELLTSPQDIDLLLNLNSPCFTGKSALNAWDRVVPKVMKKQIPLAERKKFGMLNNGDDVFVSDYTCQSTDHGKGIVAHELSHVLNLMFKNLKLSSESSAHYKKLRACVTSNNLNNRVEAVSELMENPEDMTPFEKMKSSLLHKGDGEFSEEDMADLFASISEKDSDRIFLCGLLRPTPSGSDYMNINLESSDGVHSNSLARIIQIAVNKNLPIPRSCRKLMNKRISNMEFKKCI